MNHPVETFGFRFAHGGRTLAYTGDTGETEAVAGLAGGADVFLSEAAFLDRPGLPPDLHLTARQAGAYASRAGAGRLVLTHLQPWNDPDAARAEAAASFDGRSTSRSRDRSSTCPGAAVASGAPGRDPGRVAS